MALNRKWIPSPCYYLGRPSKPRLIVLHTADGSRSIESLGRYFANPANKVSSNAGADDKPNTIGIYVDRDHRAWTQGEYNSVAISIEICGFAKWPTTEWNKHPQMLANVAAWIAEEAAVFDIPIVELSPAQAQGSGRGVCQHVDISGAGGHWDCGPGFPMGRVIQMARGGGKQQEKLTTWYYLQDVAASRLAIGQRMYYGGWASEAGADKMCDDLTRGYNHPFRRFSDHSFESPYFIDNSGYVQEIYGGWLSLEGRNRKKVELEAALGRQLRPFSEQRTEAQGGVPWGCKNLQSP